jgi:DNA-binding transcriptional ArsR family regulator
LTYGSEQPLSEAGLRICRVVSEQPGIHFRGLARAATLPAGQLRHHLDRLVRRGILVELEDGGYKRFFLAGKHDPRLRPALALFARRVPRRIGSLLLLRPMTRTELRRHLGCGDSTLGFHLARMVQAQVVTKQRDRSGCRYALAEPEVARQALAMRAAAANAEERALAAQREAAQREAWPLGPRDGLLPPRPRADLPPASAPGDGLAPPLDAVGAADDGLEAPAPLGADDLAGEDLGADDLDGGDDLAGDLGPQTLEEPEPSVGEDAPAAPEDLPTAAARRELVVSREQP